MKDMYSEFASFPTKTRGRLFVEEDNTNYRSVFQRDRDRVIHSTAFRRLEYKTQVFINHEGDHYRTRLTHSLEVSQVTRTIARFFRLNEDLAEALALAHDLGHPPFGHAGEVELNILMKDYGGFDHNAQTLKVLTKLEKKYATHDGLNLTWESLEGLVKHNGPIDIKKAHWYIKEFNEKYDLELNSFPSMEAQVASISDDIAYNNHDLEDALRASLFKVDEICDEVPFIKDIFDWVKSRFKDASKPRIVNEANRTLVTKMVSDLIDNTKINLQKYKIKTVEDIRNLGNYIVGFSDQMEEDNQLLKKYLKNHMYRHYKVSRMTTKSKRVVRDLFNLYFNEPECMPSEWSRLAVDVDKHKRAIIVTDFIAGMTDRFAIKEHQALFEINEKM